MHVSSASAACTSAGLWIFGTRMPVRPGPITAPQVLQRLAGRRRLHAREQQRKRRRAPASRRTRVRQPGRVRARHSGYGVRGSSRSTTIESAPDAAVSCERVGDRRRARRRRCAAGGPACRFILLPRSARVAAASHVVPVEEVGVRPAVHAHRVHEGELAEVALGDQRRARRARTPRRRGRSCRRTSQWEMSEPRIGRSRAPSGLTSSRNAHATSGSSASHPK